jgi:hypothetical protein
MNLAMHYIVGGRCCQNSDTTHQKYVKLESGPWISLHLQRLPKKMNPKATNFSDHGAVSPIEHTAKIVTRIIRRRIERIFEDILGEIEIWKRSGILNFVRVQL